jgi:hypothetical protein
VEFFGKSDLFKNQKLKLSLSDFDEKNNEFTVILED